jgi:flagellar biosynthesis/type III secretory pathway protein FliH
VDEAFPEQGEKIMSTLAERWIEEGKRQGLQQGLQQGTAAAAREAVVEALEARFDVIPRSLLERIEQTEDPAVLKMLLKKAVTSPTLEDFRAALEIALS